MVMENSSQGIIEAAREIAARRRETLSRLRAALECGDTEQVLNIARELCGVNHEQESNRINQSVN